MGAKQLRLRAHFDRTPSEGDLEDIMTVDAYVDGDLLDVFEVSTDIDIAPMGTTPAFLPDGIAYLREGEAGVCTC
jgi:hypothetical protein